jgi:hypothetical protein
VADVDRVVVNSMKKGIIDVYILITVTCSNVILFIFPLFGVKMVILIYSWKLLLVLAKNWRNIYWDLPSRN